MMTTLSLQKKVWIQYTRIVTQRRSKKNILAGFGYTLVSEYQFKIDFRWILYNLFRYEVKGHKSEF